MAGTPPGYCPTGHRSRSPGAAMTINSIHVGEMAGNLFA